MSKVLQDLEPLLDNIMALLAFNIGDKTDTTSIMLEQIACVGSVHMACDGDEGLPEWAVVGISYSTCLLFVGVAGTVALFWRRRKRRRIDDDEALLEPLLVENSQRTHGVVFDQRSARVREGAQSKTRGRRQSGRGTGAITEVGFQDECRFAGAVLARLLVDLFENFEPLLHLKDDLRQEGGATDHQTNVGAHIQFELPLRRTAPLMSLTILLSSSFKPPYFSDGDLPCTEKIGSRVFA